jgi:RNA polymerase sigma factor (sigma-70 family)
MKPSTHRERNGYSATDMVMVWPSESATSLRQEAEIALEAGTRLKHWKSELTRYLPPGWLLQRGLMTWKVLSARRELVVPKSILKGIVDHCIERVFGGDTQNGAQAAQLGDGDVEIVDRGHRHGPLEGLFADFEQVMASIDPVDGAIFRLHHFQGYSYREIAEALGISPSHAQRRHEDIKAVLASRLRVYRT